MKRFVLSIFVLFAPLLAVAQERAYSIEIDAKSLAPVQTDAISGVMIDKINPDRSQRPCARIKIHINRMSSEEIAELSVKTVGGNVEVMRQVVARQGNGMIIELTAKDPTRFYLHHPKYGDSNEVSLSLEGNKEYRLEAQLNYTHTIVVISNVANAEVYVDDFFKGRTREDLMLNIKEILPGQHTIRVEDGSRKIEKRVEVSDDNVSFRLNISRKTAKLPWVIFKVSPENAQVSVGGTVLSVDPNNKEVRKNLLPSGTYPYTVSAKDYYGEQGEIEVFETDIIKEIVLRPAFGYLSVPDTATLSNAWVYLNDSLIGKTPITKHQIASGTHKIKVVKELYKLFEDSVVIKDTETSVCSPTLFADFANVKLKADEGCDIYINGELKGRTSWSGKLVSGEYTFEARKRLHYSTRLSKSITPTTDTLIYTLEEPAPIMGTLKVVCSPAKAKVYIDEEYVGESPLSKEIIIGNHRVSLRKDGYSSAQHSAEIIEKGVCSLNITLDKIFDLTYTSLYGSTVNLDAERLDANIISHTYSNGQGIIKFDRPITRIGNGAFRGCSSLKSIAIPDSVTKIESEAFLGCSALTSITIPESVKEIGSYAFSSCSSLTNITIPNSVTEIEGGAFKGCSSLTSITIPNSVTYIGGWAFKGCSSLTSITIPNSVTGIGGWAFEGCSSLKSITIPDSVTYIGGWAFKGCASLTSITIPDSITEICGEAFKGCSSLKSITIPNSVTEIGYQAFEGCSALTSITIPESVKEIGVKAFDGCISLSTIYCNPKTTPIENLDIFNSDITIYAPLHDKKSTTKIDNSTSWYIYSSKEMREKQKRKEEYKEHQVCIGGMFDLYCITSSEYQYPSFGLTLTMGHKFNNLVFLGVGTGININLLAGSDERLVGKSYDSQALNPRTLSLPLFLYFKTNLINRRFSPYIAVAAGGFLSKQQSVTLTDGETTYKTNRGFVNPQFGLNFRFSPDYAIYCSIGFQYFSAPVCVKFDETLIETKSRAFKGWDIHFGIAF